MKKYIDLYDKLENDFQNDKDLIYMKFGAFKENFGIKFWQIVLLCMSMIWNFLNNF
ncbi:hypothetical protein O5404_00285 [Borrelia miyamotoi]|uniref:Uncharacterized protein n=1 Tax=Borrelia miyamotoi TaxID=47466 RepID=A0AAX3JLJ0_9SPIR|nr:hypothetical protein [Borrelia miyamotoi]QGT55475.1 hypothetical protein GNY89_00285 [Borrelia miyamotoi]QGT56256.1 hypothetical protein GNY88_00285 [Borrelia miyamotoi]WAZ71500.1 hypothetical protein O5404_00285 [Borrelia miyamotoi]